MTHNEISGSIIGAAIKIHRQLGPGLLESVYQVILAHEVGKAGLDVRTEVAVPVLWDSIRFDVGFRADLIVQDAVIVELKSIERLLPVHKKQLLTYLRLADTQLGLLINFGAAVLKDGICRIANNLVEE
jgi:GxxExxY protein